MQVYPMEQSDRGFHQPVRDLVTCRRAGDEDGGSGQVGQGVAMRSIDPVNDPRALSGEQDVPGVEISMA